MDNEFDEVMRKRTDSDLIRILNSATGDYQSAALEAAKREFERRSLSETQLNTIKQEIEQKNQADDAKANEPLGTGWKILACIFPGIIQLMFAGVLKADGYDRKAKEMFKWTLYGLVFYFGLIVLLVILPFLF
jgi:hypothetical protein